MDEIVHSNEPRHVNRIRLPHMWKTLTKLHREPKMYDEMPEYLKNGERMNIF